MTITITRDELEASIRTGEVLLVDALPASYYAQQHLPGAVNLVAADVTDRAPQLLLDKDALIVTYCSNTACPNSSHVAAKLESLGYPTCASTPKASRTGSRRDCPQKILSDTPRNSNPGATPWRMRENGTAPVPFRSTDRTLHSEKVIP